MSMTLEIRVLEVECLQPKQMIYVPCKARQAHRGVSISWQTAKNIFLCDKMG
jgi:hypothetical protein